MYWQKKKQFGLCCLFLVISGLTFVHFYSKSGSPLKAHPSHQVTINQGSAAALTLPTDATQLHERELSQNSQFSTFVQDQKRTVNFSKNRLHGYSTKVNHTLLSAIKTSKNEIIETRSLSNYNMAKPELTYGQIALIDKNGKEKKSLWIAGVNPDWQDSIKSKTHAAVMATYDNKNGTYTIFYKGYINAKGNLETICLIIDNNLTVKKRQTVNLNGYSLDKQTNNRSSVDLSGKLYQYTFYQEVSTVKNKYNVFEVDSNGKYTSKKQLVSMDSAVGYAKKLGSSKPSDWYDAINNNTLIRGASQEYVAISYLGNHSGKKPGFLFVNIWDKNGKVQMIYEPNNGKGNSKLKFLREISTTQRYYFQETTPTNTYLKYVDIKNKKVHLLKTYPAQTNLTFTVEASGVYSFFGYVNTFKDAFQGWGNQSSLVVGQMDAQFNILTLGSIHSNERLDIASLISLEGSHFYVGGSFQGTKFVDDYPSGNAVNKQTASMYNSFYGLLDLLTDYSPAIAKLPDLMLDIEDTDWQQTQFLDNYLITGSKEGKQTAQAVQVYDNFELNYSLDPKTPAWLTARINRNPRNLALPIDWQALGLDLTNVGPQQLTYFVSDSQMQITTTSRWLNRVDQQTVYEHEYAMHASNFHLNVEEIPKVFKDEIDVKKHSQLMLWTLVGNHQILDDATHAQSVIKVDQAQFSDIQNAYQRYQQIPKNAQPAAYADVIKPYPLTVSYRFKGAQGETTLTRVLTVFVTNETTQVSIEKNQVLYGFHFSYPLKKAYQLTDEKIIQLSQASAWQYHQRWGTDQPSTALSTNRQAPYQSSDTEKHTGLNHAQTPREDYILCLLSAALTNDKIRVNLYQNPVTLHIRQLLTQTDPQLITPTTGYFSFSQTKNDQTTVVSTIAATSLSGTTDADVAYATLKLPVTHQAYFYQAAVILPEYYEYAGYQLSKQQETQSAIQSDPPLIDFTDDHNEYWLTMYIRPSSTQKPAFYEWQYGQDITYIIE